MLLKTAQRPGLVRQSGSMRLTSLPSLLLSLHRKQQRSAGLSQLLQDNRVLPIAHSHSTAAEDMSSARTIRGVVFDMDGTMTVPVIDFKLMRQRVGVMTGDILDAINSWPVEKQQQALAAIAEIEEQALVDMKIMPGLLDVCHFLDMHGIPRGLITRNNKRSLEYFHSNHFPLEPFVPAISRECDFSYKPSPAALHHICDSWGIPTSECIMIGDSAKDDVVCGNRAGAVTILLDSYQIYGDDSKLVGECKPHHKVNSISELKTLLETEYTLPNDLHSIPPICFTCQGRTK